ncbi:hypothetical protein GCM10009760_63820 [Kitasatospora kazusensis]|uniref:Transposase n=1 Tax=Kitasatospora kazusensis TaxID=407974 RepID=A0ABN1ZMS9_9ACTN
MADPAELVGMISDQRTEHGILHTVTCRALGVSQAWFYKWRRGPATPTNREVRRAKLKERLPHSPRTPRLATRQTRQATQRRQTAPKQTGRDHRATTS